MIKYGIVGAGYFGAEIGRVLQEWDDATVTTVYDPENAARVAAELGATVAGSAAEVAASAQVDAVVVASPNWAHKGGVLAAAHAGKPVFCEKPIALSYTDCVAMLRAAAEARVVLTAGHVHIYPAG